MQYSRAKNSDFVSASVEARCLDGGSFLVWNLNLWAFPALSVGFSPSPTP